jgi:hypothetical protein
VKTVTSAKASATKRKGQLQTGIEDLLFTTIWIKSDS